MTVSEFYDIVALNEHHHIIVKDTKGDCIIADFNDPLDYARIELKIGEKRIYHMATDWEKRTYILWV